MIRQASQQRDQDVRLSQSKIPPIEAKEMAGSGFRRSRELPDPNPDIHIFRNQTSQTTVEYIACFDMPLTKYGLTTLLRAVAPYKSTYPNKMERDAILADWRLPDQKGRNNQADNLNMRHARFLGESWTTFEGSRQMFMIALESPDIPKEPEVRVVTSWPDLLNQFRRDFLTIGAAMGNYDFGKFIKNSRDLLDSGALEAMIAILRSIPDVKKDVVKWGAIDNQAFRLLTASGKASRIEFLRRAFHESTPSVQLHIIDAYMDFAFKPLRCQMQDGRHITFYFRDSDWREPTLCNFAIVDHDIQKPVSDNLSIGIKTLVDQGETKCVVDYDSIKRAHFVMPFMHWTRDSDDKRTWHFDFVPWKALPREIEGLFDRRALGKTEVDERLNPTIGLLTAAYFSPHVTSKWEKREAFPDSRPRPMAAAQVPIVAMMRKEEILNGNFIANLERYADSYV